MDIKKILISFIAGSSLFSSASVSNSKKENIEKKYSEDISDTYNYLSNTYYNYDGGNQVYGTTSVSFSGRDTLSAYIGMTDFKNQTFPKNQENETTQILWGSVDYSVGYVETYINVNHTCGCDSFSYQAGSSITTSTTYAYSAGVTVSGFFVSESLNYDANITYSKTFQFNSTVSLNSNAESGIYTLYIIDIRRKAIIREYKNGQYVYTYEKSRPYGTRTVFLKEKPVLNQIPKC